MFVKGLYAININVCSSCREFWDTAKKERKNKRNKQYGYPPVTPNASATDSLASETFDHLWEEV